MDRRQPAAPHEVVFTKQARETNPVEGDSGEKLRFGFISFNVSFLGSVIRAQDSTPPPHYAFPKRVLASASM